jgi:hypothetical protein
MVCARADIAQHAPVVGCNCLAGSGKQDLEAVLDGPWVGEFNGGVKMEGRIQNWRAHVLLEE